MNLFYSLPEDIQDFIHKLNTKEKFKHVIECIPEKVREKNEYWRAKKTHKNVISEICDLSPLIKAYVNQRYVMGQYYFHLTENMDNLDNVINYDYFKSYSEQYWYTDYIYHDQTLFKEYILWNLYSKVIDKFYLMQEEMFVNY